MRVQMIMKWDGVTESQYEQLRKTVNWEGDVPKGGVFHVASFSKDGVRVTDVWESEAELNAFLQNRLMPGVAKVGITSQPQVEVFPVYAIFAPAYEAAAT